MPRPLHILVLSDGKRGHESQSYGLVEAMGRLTPVEDRKIKLERRRSWLPVFCPDSALDEGPKPDLIVGAGHGVHAQLIGMARKTNAPCVVIMKPSLPTCFFDLCLIPHHDLNGRTPASNVIATHGALNRVPPPGDETRRGGLILIGGPSKAHGWDAGFVEQAIPRIVHAHGDHAWRATDSRRSPDGTLARLSRHCPELAVYPHRDTGRDWLPQRLAEARETWVTEDSVSMIYEALSSGSRVGLIPVPRLKSRGRVVRGIDQLAEQGYLTRLADWQEGEELPPPPHVLQESQRCARAVLQRHFPDRLP